MRTLTLLIESGLVDAAILAPACVGFSLQFGVTNYVNFAYGALLTFAAFMFWAFNTAPAFQLELLPAGIVAAGLASLLALAIGMFYTAYFRRRPQLLYALVVTFAVGIILGGIYKMLWGSSTNIVRYPTGSFAVHGLGSFQLTNLEIVYVVASLLVVIAVFALLQYTMLGKAMRAMSDDRALAA